jgi:excisionase family DNA binding protein
VSLEVLTAKEVASLLKCSRWTVYKLRDAGKIPAPFFLFDGARGERWLKSDIEQHVLQLRADVSDSAPRPFVPIPLDMRSS